MPSLVARGPSYTEFKLTCKYNEDALGIGVQDTNIELATTDDSDQLENKYLETDDAFLYIPLDHYTAVNKVVIQNRLAAFLWCDYFDDVTGDNILVDMPAEDEFLSFSAPDEVAGIFLYDLTGQFGIAVHLTIYGEY